MYSKLVIASCLRPDLYLEPFISNALGTLVNPDYVAVIRLRRGTIFFMRGLMETN